MEKKIGIKRKFAYSFYNFSAYRDFLSQGLLKAISYIFIVTLVFSTLSNLQAVKILNDDLTRIENQITKTSPDFEFKDSKLSMNYDDPIYYTYNGDSPVLMSLLNENIIIDTSGKTSSNVLDSYDNGTYINEDSITIKQFDALKQSFKFSDFYQDITFNKEILAASFSVLKPIFDFTILCISPFFSFLGNLITVFIVLGPLTMILARNFKVNLKYTQACILSFYSMTLPLLIKSLLLISGIYIESFSTIFYLLTLLHSSLVMVTLVNQQKKSLDKLI